MGYTGRVRWALLGCGVRKLGRGAIETVGMGVDVG